MIARSNLVRKIEASLADRKLVWLSGVRRAGKTTICRQMLPESVYFDCELPSVRAQLEDPEHFWRRQEGRLVVLDEVHRLSDPSGVLKIATDHFPTVRVVATGSSTLAARKKFRDSLTDRKRDLWVQPLSVEELNGAGELDLDRRLLQGGLPPAYLADELPDAFYGEWLDSFWAKDVQELFTIDKKTAFLKLAEGILRQSGQLFRAQSFSAPCEISRQTVSHYLEILATTLFAIVLRPLATGRDSDLIAAPKVYAFDTGFVAFARGWSQLRQEDRGELIEHLVLSDLLTRFGRTCVFYWRDKQKHEVDFVVKPHRGEEVHAIECKASYQSFAPGNLRVFRRHNPLGQNFLYAGNVSQPLPLSFGELQVLALPLWEPIPCR